MKIVTRPQLLKMPEGTVFAPITQLYGSLENMYILGRHNQEDVFSEAIVGDMVPDANSYDDVERFINCKVGDEIHCIPYVTESEYPIKRDEILYAVYSPEEIQYVINQLQFALKQNV